MLSSSNQCYFFLQREASLNSFQFRLGLEGSRQQARTLSYPDNIRIQVAAKYQKGKKLFPAR